MSDLQHIQDSEITVNSGSVFPHASGFTVINSKFIVISNNEKEKIQKWLNAPDCTINFQVADDKRTEGTGQWILNHPEYIKWKQSPSVLWIQGKGAPEKVWYHYFDLRDNTDQKSTFRGYLLSLLVRARPRWILAY
ncbi:hypothetical protein GYMLUDRAFT_553018 [Collybiopsis luxurians FD-317 M1]|uniref:Nephrocystin 3-like N-terminal domain-containing protein n=1 Tax=Collybiopsis luxurians FD-317 M1 TaxID=944289 RepID=A0A0D0C280_9AGAR|nr:hypothetical protein GYMLUDRAFT_553018 [Collybiopsis luxurians FD-317 M1]